MGKAGLDSRRSTMFCDRDITNLVMRLKDSKGMFQHMGVVVQRCRCVQGTCIFGIFSFSSQLDVRYVRTRPKELKEGNLGAQQPQ
jgi:hypothetical protein